MYRAILVALMFALPACSRANGEAERHELEISAAKADQEANRGKLPELAPGDHGANEADRAVTRRVRETLSKQEALASRVGNITVSTINGVVTLRGAVKSSEERMEMGRIAQGSEGAREVSNQLDVAGPLEVMME